MERMKIEEERFGGSTLYRLTGTLNDQTDLEETIAPILDNTRRLIIDLAGVDMITSAGLSVLVRIVAQANTAGGRVVLARPTPFVAGVLRTTRLDRFFDVLPSLEAADAALRSV